MWENDLAREFKKRDNKSVIGACIGTIISVSPLKATIYDGQIVIDQSNGYICNSLVSRESKYTATCQQSQHGTPPTGSQLDQVGEIQLSEAVKAGDMVLVIPSGDEQRFFIVDVLKGVS